MVLKSLFFTILLFVLTSCQEQILMDEKEAFLPPTKITFAEGEHIKWEAKYLNEEIIIIAYLDEGWITYSQYNENFLGPLPTVITFVENDLYSLTESILEENVKMKFDKESNDDLSYFETKAIFKQKVKINSGEKFVIKGNINFMTCNANGCTPPADFAFKIEINK